MQSKHISAWKTVDAHRQVAAALMPSSGTPWPFFSHFSSFNSCDLSDLPVSFCKSSFQASPAGSANCRCCSARPAPGDGWTDGRGAGKLPGTDGRLCREPHQRGTRAKGGHKSGLTLKPSSATHRGARIRPRGKPRRGCSCPAAGKRLCKA